MLRGSTAGSPRTISIISLRKEERMKTENWNGNNIRFVEVKGEWWAVLKDVCDALGLKTKYVVERLDDEVVSTDHVSDSLGRDQEMLIVNEYGIYDAVFQSRKKEAKQFRRWVYDLLKELREAEGLEGFQIFRQLDKEHQKAEMKRLREGLKEPVRVDFIKANTIANKAVSNRHDLPKMIMKGDMSPEMLKEREPILEDTVSLMKIKDEYGLNISVSDAVYKKYGA